MNDTESTVDIFLIQKSSMSMEGDIDILVYFLTKECVHCVYRFLQTENAFSLTHLYTHIHTHYWSIPLAISAECGWLDWHLECDSAVCPGLVWCGSAAVPTHSGCIISALCKKKKNVPFFIQNNK